jgi:hypothetical protein
VETAIVEAKSKVLRRHEVAIADYRLWLIANPGSMRGERIEAFNKACDEAYERAKKKS